MRASTAVLFCALFVAPALQAQVTYTKDQLIEMYKNNRAPEQGDVKRVETREMDFEGCKRAVTALVSGLGDYPVAVQMDNDLAYMTKVWTNDGAITATCSQPDRKLVITESGYK